MAEEQNPRVGEKDLPLKTSMNDVKYVRILDQNNDSGRIAKENLVLPAAQTTEMAAAIAQAESFAEDAEVSSIYAGISANEAEQSAIDAQNAQSAIILGGITHDAAAPTPGKSGKYYLTSAGAIAWISGTPTGAVGQEILVVYTAPSTYVYTLLAVTSNYVLSNDEQLVNPSVSFNKRVVVDGGTVRSKAFMQRVFEANKDSLAYTELLFVPECGAKITNGKIEKLYNLVGTNDAVQATAANRPYVGGVIAPSEKAKMKTAQGGDQFLSFLTAIEKAAYQEWSILCVFEYNISNDAPLFGGATTAILTGKQIGFHNGITSYTEPNYLNDGDFGKNIELLISNDGKGTITFAKNGVIVKTFSATSTLSAAIILKSGWGHLAGLNMSYFQIFSKVLSAHESQNLHAFLSTEFPAIETIAVGSQQVATSNLEATVLGGTTIPEVQDNAAWAALSTPAWCHYDNSAANGAIYGKLYNGYAVDTIKANAPQGFHVPSELEWTQLSESLGGDTVSGGKMKALYGGYNNAFATNESGVSLLPSGTRFDDGSFGDVNNYFRAWTNTPSSSDRRYTNTAAGIITLGIGTLVNKFGLSVRLFSNTPHIEKLTYDSGWFATDIASSPKSIRIPFGCKVTNIKCITTTSVTAIEAKLFNYAGTELETLITGKACNATTKSFSVTADQSVSYTDNYVRVTAAGNSGAGMIIYVTIEPV